MQNVDIPDEGSPFVNRLALTCANDGTFKPEEWTALSVVKRSADFDEDSTETSVAPEGTFPSNKFQRQYNMRSVPRGAFFQPSRILLNLADEAFRAYECGHYIQASKVYQDVLNRFRSEKRGSTDSTQPGILITQACLNLAQCHLKLNHPGKASEVLAHLSHPASELAIDTRHSLFIDMSRAYFRVKKILDETATGGEMHRQISTSEDNRLIRELNLFYQYSEQYVAQGRADKAEILLRQGLRRAAYPERQVYGEGLKEIIVGMLLLLVEALFSTDQLDSGRGILEEIWKPSRPLSIHPLHKHFVWMSKLHAQPGLTARDAAYTQRELRQLSLYDCLGIAPECGTNDVKQAYLLCSIIFHPDKGGDTGVFQQISEAFSTLSNPEERKRYDCSLKNSTSDK